MAVKKPQKNQSLTTYDTNKNVMVTPSTAEEKAPARPQFETAKITTKPKTVIIVKCNCGFPNNLYIRGEKIPGLSWTKGILLKNAKVDEWRWETETPFTSGEVKVLINDKVYEKGNNHKIECGTTSTFTPSF
jgi:hypothetical protein